MNTVARLAYDLCGIVSLSGTEKTVTDYLSSWLEARGLIVEKIFVTPERYSLFVFKKSCAQYSLLYCTHLDTVAPFIAPRIDENAGILWGRGSCDAKGIASAMIHAALSLFDEGHDDIALLFTVGEEESSDGAKACAAKLVNRARFIIVGEPTDLKAACAQKGNLVFDIIGSGVEAHSSMPERGSSANHKLVHVLDALLREQWPRDDRFGDTTLNIGLLHGGIMRNTLAPHAVGQVIMRTSVRSQELIARIDRLVQIVDDVHYVVTSASDPFTYVVPDGFASFLAGFGSDAPYLSPVGTAMLLGPGSLDFAHRPDEHIRLSDLDRGVDAYRRVAMWCKKRIPA